ncbi:hypothetical protein ACIQNT_36945 [Streptomyces luteogriseus]|uniref:hypothetical protein n=1 Tax=Streptomyces luteogriseus TaxID=68233 RepID=UPI0038239555
MVATCGGTLFQHFFRRTGEQIRDATAVAARPSAGQAPSRPGEFTDGTFYRVRAGGWKRPALAAVAVFGLTMTGITTYELMSGHNLSGGRSTTVGDTLACPGASERHRERGRREFDPGAAPTPPEPSASSRSGTADPDRDDPAAP